jgi:Fe-S cluster biosynthesis and repair protein YggX
MHTVEKKRSKSVGRSRQTPPAAAKKNGTAKKTPPAAPKKKKAAVKKTPTQRQQRTEKKTEKKNQEELQEKIYAAVPKKLWQEWSGRHYKVINNQADNYGAPLRGTSIDLPKLARWLHDFLAENSERLKQRSAQGGPTDAELNEAKLHFTQERTRIAQLTADQRGGQLLPREEVHALFSLIAGVFRQATETLLKRCGEDAHQIMADAVAEAEARLDELEQQAE